MKGYCSPLASTDYNVNLAKRRISSLRNYFMEYENGIFVPYVNSTNVNEASIAFFNEDIGELKAHPNVSDDYYDTKNSIFNPAAAIERKIQIIAVSTVSSKKLLNEEVPVSIQDTVKAIVNPAEVIVPLKEITPEVPVISQTGAFAVQVSVSSHLSKAQATESSLKKIFKQPVIIVTEGGVFKVRISGFNTYDDAKLLLTKIRETGFPDAFIVSPKKE
ncbi:MAG: SPOR domain-containing protein [Bacteroidetes bacterium]|nr:SPOR domain-containing protein [Bacteroidota bacterium]